jgi:acyl-coenzyme A thioesterase PaaI-like protein
LDKPSLLPFTGGLVPAENGPWAGWYRWAGTDPFEDGTGPFYLRRDEQGIVTGFLPGPANLNGHGNVHGGCLMTFADFSLFMFAAADGQEVNGVTVSMNSEFIGAAESGVLLEARGELLGGGRSLAFVRGVITAGTRRILSFSGTIKRTLPPSAH